MSTLKSSAEDLTLNADGSGNDIIFQSNGSTVATLDQAGTLTATTFTGAATDSTKLPLAGGTLTGNTNLTKSSPVLKVNESGGGDVRIHATGSAGGIGTYSNHPFSILTNSSDALTIDTSGNVGIGGAPTAPNSDYKTLEIKNTVTSGKALLALTAKSTEYSHIYFGDENDQDIGGIQVLSSK